MALRDIYAALSEMAVGDVPCRNLDEIKLDVSPADCPTRLLLPSTEGEMGFVGLGPTSRVAWRVRDLCLWQPVMAGTGIQQCADDMLGYLELYQAAVRALRNPTSGSSIVGVTYQMGPVAWADSDFWAIDIILEVEEYDP